jgi:hypothetical protein
VDHPAGDFATVGDEDFLEHPTAPHNRHPELVSGSMVHHARTERDEKWMLKQVQHDE